MHFNISVHFTLRGCAIDAEQVLENPASVALEAAESSEILLPHHACDDASLQCVHLKTVAAPAIAVTPDGDGADVVVQVPLHPADRGADVHIVAIVESAAVLVPKLHLTATRGETEG